MRLHILMLKSNRMRLDIQKKSCVFIFPALYLGLRSLWENSLSLSTALHMYHKEKLFPQFVQGRRDRKKMSVTRIKQTVLLTFPRLFPPSDRPAIQKRVSGAQAPRGPLHLHKCFKLFDSRYQRHTQSPFFSPSSQPKRKVEKT